MQLEAEVYGFVLSGFCMVSLFTLIILGFLFWKSRHRAILWFLGQLATLSGSFWFFFQALSLTPAKIAAKYPDGFPMYSEELSLRIALAGVLWEASMVCMLCGIYKLLRKSPVIHQF